MTLAIDAAAAVRCFTTPNPWVGAVLQSASGVRFAGATQPPGGAHAEIMALRAAGEQAVGATIATTLEPCSHHGRTGPCADALIDARVSRVVIGALDPDPKVSGQGVTRLRAAGIDVVVGVGSEGVERQLRPYLHHRRTARPYVVLKLAATLDGRTAAPDGSSRWITGADARADAHRIRAESDAVIVGAGTVRADDPALTVRLPESDGRPWRQPRRIVLGRAPAGAAVHPCTEWDGRLDALLDRLGAEDVVQVMVEGGATVASAFHRSGLVDRYVLYLAPALMGGDDGRGVFAGPGAPTINGAWRGAIADVRRLGADLRIDLDATP